MATPTEINLVNSSSLAWTAGSPYPDPNNPQQTMRDVSGAVTLSGAGISYGPIASLPGTPTAAGTVYICTDSGYWFLSNGSAWLAYYNGWPVTRPPNPSGMTWVAQGSATASRSTGPLVLHQPHTGNDTLASLVVTPPSAPYTYSAGCSVILPSQNFFQAGLILRDSSTGKSIVFSAFNGNGGSSGQPCPEVQIVRYTQPSSGSATFDATTLSFPFMGPDPVFLRVYNDGTNLNYSVGRTPFDYELLLSESKSAWIGTINQVGLFADANYSNYFAHLNCFHFAQT